MPEPTSPENSPRPVPDGIEPRSPQLGDTKKYKMRSMSTDLSGAKKESAPIKNVPRKIEDLKKSHIKPPDKLSLLKPLGGPQPIKPQIKNRYLSPPPPAQPPATPPIKFGVPPKKLPLPPIPEIVPPSKKEVVKKPVDIEKILEDYKKSAVRQKSPSMGVAPRKIMPQKPGAALPGTERYPALPDIGREKPTTSGPTAPTPPSKKESFFSKIFGQSPGSRKIIMLGAIASAILLFIVGEIWWFFIKPTPEDTAPPIEEVLPSPEETLLLPRNEPVIIEAAIPASLLSYDRIIELENENRDSESIGNAITKLTEETFANDILARIIPIIPNSNNEDLEVINLNVAISALKIDIPSSITNHLTGAYDLFILSGTIGPRLGLAIKTDGSETLEQSLRNWEESMIEDLINLILANPIITSGNFLNAQYKGIDIRYRNLPADSVTIDYTHTNNILLISTSKNSMFRAIDALP